MFDNDGFISLREFTKKHGYITSTALAAARDGRFPGAQLRQLGGYTVWYVPENSEWKPQPMGRPVGTRFPKKSANINGDSSDNQD